LSANEDVEFEIAIASRLTPTKTVQPVTGKKYQHLPRQAVSKKVRRNSQKIAQPTFSQLSSPMLTPSQLSLSWQT
jgi:hypothetical protein